MNRFFCVPLLLWGNFLQDQKCSFPDKEFVNVLYQLMTHKYLANWKFPLPVEFFTNMHNVSTVRDASSQFDFGPSIDWLSHLVAGSLESAYWLPRGALNILSQEMLRAFGSFMISRSSLSRIHGVFVQNDDVISMPSLSYSLWWEFVYMRMLSGRHFFMASFHVPTIWSMTQRHIFLEYWTFIACVPFHKLYYWASETSYSWQTYIKDQCMMNSKSFCTFSTVLWLYMDNEFAMVCLEPNCCI